MSRRSTVLMLVAAAALAGAWLGRTGARPRAVRLVFPAGAPPAQAVIRLDAGATIEEAMLLKVMGVVRSLDGNPLRYPVANVWFRDADGHVLDRARGCVVPEVLAAHERGRFVLVTRADPRVVEAAVTLSDVEGRPLAADYSRPEPAQGFVQP